MRQATRWLVIAALGATGVAGVAGVAACGPVAARETERATESTVEVIDALGVEAGALAAIGLDPADMAPEPSASAGPQRRGEQWRKRHALRVLLRKDTLHGEAVVQARDGTTKTVVVQRGTVTARTDTTITVKSADGFTLTWTFGDPLHVVEHRGTIRASEIGVGIEVGVAGGKDGSTPLARLIVIPRKK